MVSLRLQAVLRPENTKRRDLLKTLSSRDGRELYYVTPDNELMAVDVEAESD